MDNCSEDISMSSDEDGVPRHQPYKRLEFAVNQIVEVAVPLHLKTLRTQLDAIQSFQEQKKWTSMISEQVNASNTFRLLKADIYELENLNSLVRPEDEHIFIQKIRSPTREVVDALASFSEYHPGIMQPLLYVEEESELQQEIPLLRCSDSEGQPESPEECRVICNLTEVKIAEKSKIAQHWMALKKELTEVNELIKKFAGLVFFQQDSVNSIEENVSSARANVEAGTRHLGRATILKSATVPLTGALLGGLILGPAGALVGFKLFGSAACAVSGGILGYGVGKKLKSTRQSSCEFEMKALTAPPAKPGSTSLPDLTATNNILEEASSDSRRSS